MCEYGDWVFMDIVIPASVSSTGKERIQSVHIDSCIAPIVKALNAGGVITIASCCGHKRKIGSIILADGREFVICPDHATGRKVDKMIGVNVHGEVVSG